MQNFNYNSLSKKLYAYLEYALHLVVCVIDRVQHRAANS